MEGLSTKRPGEQRTRPGGSCGGSLGPLHATTGPREVKSSKSRGLVEFFFVEPCVGIAPTLLDTKHRTYGFGRGF